MRVTPDNHHIAGKQGGAFSFTLLLLLTFVLIARPQDYLLWLVPLRPVLVITGLTLIATFLQRRARPIKVFSLPEARLLTFFYLVLIAGIPFAVHRGLAFDFAFKYFLMTLLFFFLVATGIRSFQQLYSLLWTAMAGALFSALFYLKQALPAQGLGYRMSASRMYDPNDIALIFVTYLPLSLYFLLAGKNKLTKYLALLTAFSLLIGTLLTKSRGGTLSLAMILVLMLFRRAPHWRGITKAVTLVLLAGTFLVYFPTLEESRFSDMESDYNITAPGGRLHIWRQNFSLFLAHPLSGVGGGCATAGLGFMRAEEGGLQAWQAPHSALLQIAVETGVPGLFIFLLLNGAVLRSFRRTRKGKDPELSLLATFAEISFFGFWVSALFLTQGYADHLYLLFAVSAVMRLQNRNLQHATTDFQASAPPPITS